MIDEVIASRDEARLSLRAMRSRIDDVGHGRRPDARSTKPCPTARRAARHRDPGSVRRERAHRGRRPAASRTRATTRSRPTSSTAPAAAPRRTATSDTVIQLFGSVIGTTTESSPTSTPRSTTCAASGFTDDQHRHRRVLLRRTGHVPRRGRSAALGAAVGFYGGGIVTGRFPQFPRARRPGRRRCRRRGSACSATRTRRSRSTTSSSCATALGGAPVDTEVVRYADAEPRLPLRRARRATTTMRPPTRGTRTLDWFARHLA